MFNKKFFSLLLVVLMVVTMAFTITACNNNSNPNNNNNGDEDEPTVNIVDGAAFEATLLNNLELDTYIEEIDKASLYIEYAKNLIHNIGLNLEAAQFPQEKADILATCFTNNDDIISNLKYDGIDSTFEYLIRTFLDANLTSDDAGLIVEALLKSLATTLNDETVYDNCIDYYNDYFENFDSIDKSEFEKYSSIKIVKEIYCDNSSNIDLLTESEYNEIVNIIKTASDNEYQMYTYSEAMAKLNAQELIYESNYCSNLRQYCYRVADKVSDDKFDFDTAPKRVAASAMYSNMADTYYNFKSWFKDFRHNENTTNEYGLQYIYNLLTNYKTDINVDTTIIIPTDVSQITTSWAESTYNKLLNEREEQRNIYNDYKNYANKKIELIKIEENKELISQRFGFLTNTDLLETGLPLINKATVVIFKSMQTIYGNEEVLNSITDNDYTTTDIDTLIASLKSVINEIDAFFTDNKTDIDGFVTAINNLDNSTFSIESKYSINNFTTTLTDITQVSNKIATILNNLVDCVDSSIITNILSYKDNSSINENLAITIAKLVSNLSSKYNTNTATAAIMEIYDDFDGCNHCMITESLDSIIHYGDEGDEDSEIVDTYLYNYDNFNIFIESRDHYEYNELKLAFPDITIILEDDDFEDESKTDEFIVAVRTELESQETGIRTIIETYLNSTLDTFFSKTSEFSTLKDMDYVTATNGAEYEALIAEITNINEALDVNIDETCNFMAENLFEMLNVNPIINPKDNFDNAEIVTLNDVKEITVEEDEVKTIIYAYTPNETKNYKILNAYELLSVYYKDGVIFENEDNYSDNIKLELQAGITYYLVLNINENFTFEIQNEQTQVPE